MNNDIRVLNTNLYINASIFIGANHEYTSPFLNVYEEKKEKFHSSLPNQTLGAVVYTIYYNSKAGKFERKNFNSATLRKIEDFKLSESNLTSVELNDVSLKDFEIDFYEKFNNKLVILKSVDLELKKKAIKETNDLDNSKFTTSAHLEFLPPVMTIIGYKFSDDKKKVCDDTGAIKLEFKCKWYNNAAKTFSEEYLPYQVLAFIENSEELNNKIKSITELIKSKSLIQIKLENPILFKNDTGESTSEVISYELLKPLSIAFYHYHHQLLVNSLFSDKIRKQNIEVEYNICKDVLGVKYQKDEDKVTIYQFNPNNYYLIKYKDKNNNVTKRIIRINYIYSLDIFNGMQTIPNEQILQFYSNLKINANCLLRRGEIRNFRLQGMLEITPINHFGNNQSFFESEFVEETQQEQEQKLPKN